MIRRIALGGVAALLAAGVGCRGPVVASDVSAQVPPTSRTPPPGANWPVPPEQAERLLSQAPMQLDQLKPTEHGVAGAMKGKVTFPREHRDLEVKWKSVSPGHPDGWNNNPRKELATYVIQKWFLAPQDYVVPTIAVRCVPLADYKRFDPDAKPTVEGTTCVLGTLSVWLRDVDVPKVLLDPARFANDPNYAYHLSNFNILAYLVEHRDGRPGNILVAEDESNRRVYAVDNGISFGGLVYNFLTTNWDVIRVPSIRHAVVEKLRAVHPDQLAALGTLVELRADANGILQPVPPSAPMNPTEGVRIAGGQVQMGLTTDEIDGVSKRLAALLEEVDHGKLAVF
jgi:hypothetical protein